MLEPKSSKQFLQKIPYTKSFQKNLGLNSF